jgi:hypothetical protein
LNGKPSSSLLSPGAGDSSACVSVDVHLTLATPKEE